MYADGYGRMGWRGRSMPCWPKGAAARDSAWTVRITGQCVHGIELPRRMEAAKRCSAERGVPRAVPPSWNWSTKQPEVRQVKNSMDRRGFLRLGAFGTAALAAGTGCGEEALPPAPYEGTPHFVRSTRTGMKITIVSMGAMRTSEPIFGRPLTRGSAILTRRAATWTDATRGWWAKRSKATATACTWPPR